MKSEHFEHPKNQNKKRKVFLMSEGKLTKWAEKELAKARKEPESSYTNLENL